MAITPNGKTLYVTTNNNSTTRNTVTPIVTATKKAGQPTSFAPGAGGTPSPLVTPVSIATEKPGRAIDVGPTASSLYVAITPNGGTVYFNGNWYGHHGSALIPISTATDTVGKHMWPSFAGPMAFTPDGKTGFAIDSSGALGVVVSFRPVDNVLKSGFWVGKAPAAIAITP